MKAPLHAILALAALALIPLAALAVDQKPKPPSKREAREIEKQLKARFEYDRLFTVERRTYFNDSSAVIGQPIASVIQKRGAPSRVVGDGLGGKIYAYDRVHSMSSGSVYALFEDLYVDANRRVIKYHNGTRGLGGNLQREKMVQMKTEPIPFPGKNAAEIAALLRAHVAARGYMLQYSPADQVVYRDFKQFGTMQECGADLYGKVRVTATPRDGSLEYELHVENFSTLFGAKLLINDNDDVASEGDVPFNHFYLVAPENARFAYPEAIYDHKKKLLNPIVNDRFVAQADSYRNELLALALKK